MQDNQNIKAMKPITPAQLKMLHVLLGQSDLMGRKADLVYSFSHGRTESSRELDVMEARGMIEYLKRTDETERLIKAVWHLAYEMKIIFGEGRDENSMNAAKLDMFCKTRGTVKKNLREQTCSELKKTHRQFEAMYKKYRDRQDTAKVTPPTKTGLPEIPEDETIKELENELRLHIKLKHYEMCAKIKKELDDLK